MSEENDEITFSEDGEEESSAALVKKLRDKLKETEKKAEEYLTGWQKERAEAVNTRKRMEEEKKEFAKYANENLIMEILPALDSFDMAMANKKAWEELPSVWTKGIEYIYTQLISALEAQGIKRIYPINENFDPARDDAIEMVEVDDKEKDHKIVEVIQPGYIYNGKPVRSAKVKVGEYKGN